MTLSYASQRSRLAFDVLRATLTGSPPVRIFFMHVPKCGGVSVSAAITRRFGYATGMFAGRGLFSIDPVASKRVADLIGMTSEQYREYLLLFGMAHKGIRYISGHVPFSKRGYQEFGDSWDVVTILRDPVSKWFSQYFYNRYKTSDHSRVDEELETFVHTSTAVDYGCDYVRYLSSHEGNPTSEEAIAAAIGNLACLSVVGVLEDLQKFAHDFRRHFAFDIDIGSANSNPLPAKERDSRISPEVRREVERLCLPNQQVYEAVLDRVQSVRR